MRVGVVDIGTNSMRLLVTDGHQEVGRWVEVTGLGRGVDATGELAADAVERTIGVFARFGEIMDLHDVGRRAAIATSATRDAANREQFLEKATAALGVRPDVITGSREGRLAYSGATDGLDGGPFVVSDIGGGSSEFVTSDRSVSIDLGSVRLSDRILSDRPPGASQMDEAQAHVGGLFSTIEMRGDLIGVAGTWTSLGAIDLGLDLYDRSLVHHHQMTRDGLSAVIRSLATMTVEETASIPSLDPARAPVILAGAVVAAGVMDAVDADTVLISEHDTLDGLAAELLAVT
jgi:exopolyphosphatase / guanosine-5'-triphosphate,3'-diphosphate pyrophosphatase